VIRLAAVALLLLGSAGVRAVELDTRFKLFGTGAALPEHNLARQQEGTPLWDYTGEVRLMLSDERGPFTFVAHGTANVVGGDSFGRPEAPELVLDQTPLSDKRRLMGLTWKVEDGSRHETVARLDRLFARYQADTWSLTAGRQAVTWGNGVLFQPLDLFNPFAPTTVDQDYKPGDDLVEFNKLFANGMDLQLLGVARRDDDGDVTRDDGSLALRIRGFAGSAGWELATARHYGDEIYALGLRLPVGGALLRSDIVATDERHAGWELSVVVNADYSFELASKNVYVFAEYFHNGFGVDSLPDSPLLLPEDLLLRLGRGELFTLMQDYLAVGSRVEWHPLWNQSVSLISNLQDGSNLLQTEFNFQPGDNTQLDFGVVLPLGHRGDEYGGIPLAGDEVTAGGARQGYVRFVYYL